MEQTEETSKTHGFNRQASLMDQIMKNRDKPKEATVKEIKLHEVHLL
jgi:hypothetical protein